MNPSRSAAIPLLFCAAILVAYFGGLSNAFAGDARGFSGATSVRERSNVVVVSLPAGDNGSFGF